MGFPRKMMERDASSLFQERSLRDRICSSNNSASKRIGRKLDKKGFNSILELEEGTLLQTQVLGTLGAYQPFVRLAHDLPDRLSRHCDQDCDAAATEKSGILHTITSKATIYLKCFPITFIGLA